MKKLIFGIVFVLILFPVSQSFSQEYTDTNPTLIVSTNSNTNYVYHTDDLWQLKKSYGTNTSSVVQQYEPPNNILIYVVGLVVVE